MVQMKRLSTRELIFAMSGAILVLATLGAGSALAQGAAAGGCRRRQGRQLRQPRQRHLARRLFQRELSRPPGT